ncbi:MAG TPA: YCF48-related protein [bacterium]|nr:YCF48-related protein [bacterium]
MPFLLLLLLALAGCTGSGAVNPLTPQKAAQSDSLSAPESDVIYWTSFPVTFTLTDTLNGVDILSSKSGWACGNNGTILRYDGTTWSKLKSGLAQTENFMAVGFSDENNGWIVGTHGVILAYKAGNWSLFPSPTQQNLYGLSVLPNRTAWAVGANGTLLNFNGVSWSVIDPNKFTPPLTVDLNDINFADQNNGWAVGNQGTILGYDGQSWKSFAASPSTERLNSVAVINNQQAWIVGAYGTILRFNGTTWSSLGTAFSGFDLYQVFMKGESDGWAVGQDGTIIYYDGSRWIPHPKPDNKPSLNALSFSGDTGFAVGQGGAIFKFQSKGESPKFSFLFKGEWTKPAKGSKLWTLTYTILNQSLKASPAVALNLPLPDGFKPYEPKAEASTTPTPGATPTVTPTASPTPSILGTPQAEGGKTLVQSPPVAMTAGWRLDGNKVLWDLGAVASSEIKTLSLQFEVPKNWDPKKPALFKAALMANNQDVADAEPVTLLLAPPAPKGLAVPQGTPAATPGATLTPSP